MRNTAENSPVLFTQELVEKCRALIVAKKLALSLSLSLWDHLLGMAGTRYISIYAQRATCSCHDDDAAAQMRSTSLPLPQTNIPGSFISCAIFSLFSRFFFSTNNRWISFVFFLFFFGESMWILVASRKKERSEYMVDGKEDIFSKGTFFTV